MIRSLLWVVLFLSLPVASASEAIPWSDWTESTYSLREKLEKTGMDRPLATVIINNCKAKALDPRHCVVTAAFISCAESSCWKNAKNYNVFWITSSKKYFSSRESAQSYADKRCWSEVVQNSDIEFVVVRYKFKSRTDAVRKWVCQYNKTWYKNKSPDDFYKKSPSHSPRSAYCMSEIQPDKTHLNYCKHWTVHAWRVFTSLSS